MADNTQLKQEDTSMDVEVSQPADPPATVNKVELDLDDAPFLQSDEKAPPSLTYEEQLPAESGEAEAGKAKQKKKKILIIAGAALLVIIGAAVWWFFFRTPPPPPPEAPKPEVIVVPSAPAGTQNKDIIREFAEFIVPVKDENGKDRFLICKFSTITKEGNVNKELEQQMVALRDAIYFYLRSKPSTFLLNARNGNDIKKDLLSVFNDYLSQGKLEDIVFESYLSK